jgi:hypothetical protein
VLVAISSSDGISILRNTPTVVEERPRDPGRARPRVEAIVFPSHTASPIIHTHLCSAAPSSSATLKAPNTATPALRKPPSFVVRYCRRSARAAGVDEVLAQGVWITGARRLCGYELVEAQASIRFAVTAASALSRNGCERAAAAVKATATNVLAKRK